MTKRQCPFETGILPQLKVRLNQKVYDRNHDENMSKIQDKTIQMLFKGAKQVYQANDDNLKQKLLGFGFENTFTAANITEFCSLCNDLNLAECKCSYCDKWVCKNCSAFCRKCLDTFCTKHSLKLYSANDDSICLNCCVENS